MGPADSAGLLETDMSLYTLPAVPRERALVRRIVAALKTAQLVTEETRRAQQVATAAGVARRQLLHTGSQTVFADASGGAIAMRQNQNLLGLLGGSESAHALKVLDAANVTAKVDVMARLKEAKLEKFPFTLQPHVQLLQ